MPVRRVVNVKKRHSHVMKLTQENEKLKAELQAMTDRLEAAERKRKELQKKQQQELVGIVENEEAGDGL